MSRMINYSLIGITCLSLSYFWSLPHKKADSLSAPALKSQIPKITAASLVKKEIAVTKVPRPKTAPQKIGTLNNIAMSKVSFDNLPGWDEADVKKSLLAFQTSCQTFLKQHPTHPVGSPRFKLKAGDWHPACKAAMDVDVASETKTRSFFENWFHPIEFEEKKTIHGLFTGYYMPQLDGSLTRTKEFNTPIYGLPKSLSWSSNRSKKRSQSNVHFTRQQIDKGALDKKAPVIAWINSPVERLFLEIEGSGVIQLPTGKRLYLGYAGENGAHFTSIGKVLIQKGVMTKNTASKGSIKKYLQKNPGQMDSILHKNKSFVFFQSSEQPSAIGVKGIELTPGYSLAIDKKWIPIGAPLWLNTTTPVGKKEQETKFQRLMIAQDTGGAIRGLMRGDVYWGSGKEATYLGEHMKTKGRFWLLLPKYAMKKLFSKFNA